MGKWHKGRIRGFFRDGKRKVDLQLKQLADSGRPLDISLTNDFAFKKTFRNKIALTGLLSSLLDIPAGEITSLEFPDTFLHGEYAEDREGILDVKVRLNHCKKVNIEIQLLSHPFWEELERLNADKELRYLYLERLKAASGEATMQSYYKRLAEDAQKNGLAQGLEQGLTQGLEQGLSQGLEQGLSQGLEQGLSQGIKALIKDNLEEGKDKKVILTKLEKHFSLTEKEAQAYFDMYNNMS